MLELSLNVQLCEKIEQKYTLRTPPLSVESGRDRIRRLQAESRAAAAEAVAAAAQNPVRAATEAANAQLQARRAAAKQTPPMVERTLSLRWSRQGLTIVLSLEGAEEPLGALSEAIHAILRDEEKRAAERWGDADAAAAADADVAAARTRDPDAATVDAWAARLADASSSSSRAPGVTPGVPSAAELLDLLAARAPPELVPRPPPAADVVASASPPPQAAAPLGSGGRLRGDLDRLFADVGPLDEGPVRVRVNISIVR